MNQFLKYMILTFAVFIFSFSFFVAKANAASFYVNNTLGTDDGAHGTGIDTDAWATLKYALTGSRVAKGDTVYVQAGTWTEDQIFVVVGAGDGNPVTVQNYNDDVVTIQTGTTTLGLVVLSSVNMVFDGINIDNNNAAMVGKYLFGLTSTTVPVSLTFQNASIDGLSSSGALNSFKLYGSQPHSLTVNKANIINGGNVINILGTSSSTNTVNIYSSVITESSSIFTANDTSPTDLTMINNTFARPAVRLFYLYPVGSSVVAKNNIFLAGGAYADIILDLGGTFGDAVITDNSIFDVTYNYYYSEDSSFNGPDTYNDIVKSNTVVPYIPKENWFVNPLFTSIGSDYTLQSGSLVAGRGTNQHPPDGTDINGVPYGANDVGPYANPSLTALPAVSSDEIAWFGDSIMLGTGATTEATKGYYVFQENTGETITNYAVGGHTARVQFWTIDQSIWTGREATAIVAVGINELQSPRSAQTNAQVSDKIITILQKLDAAGIEPVSLGISSMYGDPPDNSDVTAIVDAVLVECTSQGWSCGSLLVQMQNAASWSTDYYDDITLDVHPNDSGHALLARLAEYLYYQKYTIGTDEVDIGAGARIFADGKFRNVSATTGVTADFTVTPVGGVGAFDSDDRSAYMDITISNWSTSGDKDKTWTASSSTGAGYIQAGSTIYTIGDLLPNAFYQFKLDGSLSTAITGSTCSGSLCQADSSGSLTFTYTGGYSSHTFNLDRLYISSSVPSAPAPSISGSSSSDSITETSTESGTCSTGYNPGDLIDISWSTSSSVNLVNLYYSTDRGLSYTKIVGPVTNNEKYSWKIPTNITGSTLQFKVEGTDLALITATYETNQCLLNGTDTTDTDSSDTSDTDSSDQIETPTTGEQMYSPVTGELEDVSIVESGDFIKSPYFSTIYYVTNELTRRPFIDTQTFFTYTDSFSEVKTVTDATLTTLPLGSAMLPNPGVVLVKIQSDPKTYAIDEDNNLRWITTEDVAMVLYGTSWADYIIDIEPTFFTKFGTGTSIVTDSDFLVSTGMKTRAELQ